MHNKNGQQARANGALYQSASYPASADSDDSDDSDAPPPPVVALLPPPQSYACDRPPRTLKNIQRKKKRKELGSFLAKGGSGGIHHFLAL